MTTNATRPGRRQAAGLRWGEGSIKERRRADGSASFQARWVDDAHGPSIEHARTFATRDEAEDFLRAQHRAKRDGRYAPPSTLTIAQLLDGWLRRGASRWRGSTLHTYRENARIHLLETEIGSWRASDLTPARMQHWVDAQVAAGRPAPTLNATLQILKMAFREGSTLGFVPTNPMLGVRGPTHRPKRAETWTLAEVTRVFAAVAGDPMWSAVYRLALTTGMRPGELRSLRWADVDFTQGLVRIQRTIAVNAAGQAVVGTATKTGRDRSVAVPASTMRILSVWRAARKVRRIGADDDFVFGNDEGRFLCATRWHTFHRRLIARADVTAITVHQMRHTNATLELEAGTHPKVVSDRLGHARVAMTLDRYSHVSVDLQRAAAEALDARLSESDARVANTTT